MLRDVIDGLLAAVFVIAAGAKLRRPGATAAALATYGLTRARARATALAGLVAVELGLAAGIALGSDVASWGAAALVLAFTEAGRRVLRRRGPGVPCACFGSGSRLTPRSLVRNLVLAGALAGAPALDGVGLSTQDALVAGLAVCLAGLAGLGVAVLALAREVGVLRRELVPAPALEIPEEGPALGSRTALIERFGSVAPARWGLAVFTSEGCALCQALSGPVAALGRDPLVALELFDEQRDALVWRALRIPGSPFAVAMDPAGHVLAKGTFNSAAQLEGILASAERRERPAAHA